MRTLDPFAFFFEHASAIAGYGGEVASPDPRYCFHTHYEEVRAGPACFHIRLQDVKASRGELTLRVHGYRADGSHDAVLVAGSRLDFEHGMTGDVALDVRFRAVRDVNYAFYGYFTEPSDLCVGQLGIALEELEEEGSGSFEEDVATSVLAATAIGTSASQSSALVLGRTASLDVPVSQDCTVQQLRAGNLEAARGRAAVGEDDLQIWRETVCRNALVAYGAVRPAMRGLATGSMGQRLLSFCEEAGMSLHIVDWQPQQGIDVLAADGHFDFLVSMVDIGAIERAEERYEALSGLLSRLLVGGLGLVCFRYVPDVTIPSGAAERESTKLTRNEIGKWVLRLIGAGFSAAPLAFARPSELARDEAGRAAIVLVLRRL